MNQEESIAKFLDVSKKLFRVQEYVNIIVCVWLVLITIYVVTH